jgi:hypothetical protein
MSGIEGQADVRTTWRMSAFDPKATLAWPGIVAEVLLIELASSQKEEMAPCIPDRQKPLITGLKTLLTCPQASV